MELASGTYVNRAGAAYPRGKAKLGRLEKADVIKIIDDASSAEENAVIAAPKLTFLSGISWRRIARIGNYHSQGYCVSQEIAAVNIGIVIRKPYRARCPFNNGQGECSRRSVHD